MTTTPNMNLALPVEGGSNDVWAVLLDAIFALIDAHDHTTGKGVKVPSNALSIIGDIPMATHAFTGLSVVAFTEIAAAAAAGYEGLFVNSADHNLYFRNQAGTNVQVTSGNTINVSIVGGIGGDYASVNALLSYVDANLDYLLQQEGSPRPWAGLRTGDIKLYQKAVGIANFVALISPAALAASYTMTMPAALPGSTVLMQLTAAGVLTPSNTLPINTSITVSGNGTLKTGNKGVGFAIDFTDTLESTGATPGHAAGAGGCQVVAGTVVFFRLPRFKLEERLNSLTVFASDAGTAAGYALFSYNESSTTYTAVAGATGTLTAGAVTLTPNTPTTAVGTVYVLRVQAGSGISTIKKGEYLADTP